MIRKDYIMRMIEQLAQVMAKVMSYKQAQNFERAEEELNLAAEQFFGLKPELLDSMSAEDLISFLQLDHVLNSQKCLILAEILRGKAELAELTRDPAKTDQVYSKSLRCYLQAFTVDRDLRKRETTEKIDFLLNKTKNNKLSPDFQFRLFRYCEQVGRFAKAEDILFDLAESRHPNIYSEGVSYFKRLLAKSDDELIRGELPREEVEEGLGEFTKFE